MATHQQSKTQIIQSTSYIKNCSKTYHGNNTELVRPITLALYQRQKTQIRECVLRVEFWHQERTRHFSVSQESAVSVMVPSEHSTVLPGFTSKANFEY